MRKNGVKKKQVKNTRKNQQLDVYSYPHTISIHEQLSTFFIFRKSFFWDELNTDKSVSVQPHRNPSSFDESFMLFIRFKAEHFKLNEKV